MKEIVGFEIEPKFWVPSDITSEEGGTVLRLVNESNNLSIEDKNDEALQKLNSACAEGKKGKSPTEIFCLAGAYNNRGIHKLYRNDIEDAKKDFVAAINADSQMAPARINLGNAFLREGKCDDALEELNAAQKIEPGRTTIHVLKAIIWTEKGESEKALEEALVWFPLLFDISIFLRDLISAILDEEKFQDIFGNFNIVTSEDVEDFLLNTLEDKEEIILQDEIISNVDKLIESLFVFIENQILSNIQSQEDLDILSKALSEDDELFLEVLKNTNKPDLKYILEEIILDEEDDSNPIATTSTTTTAAFSSINDTPTEDSEILDEDQYEEEKRQLIEQFLAYIIRKIEIAIEAFPQYKKVGQELVDELNEIYQEEDEVVFGGIGTVGEVIGSNWSGPIETKEPVATTGLVEELEVPFEDEEHGGGILPKSINSTHTASITKLVENKKTGKISPPHPTPMEKQPPPPNLEQQRVNRQFKLFEERFQKLESLVDERQKRIETLELTTAEQQKSLEAKDREIAELRAEIRKKIPIESEAETLALLAEMDIPKWQGVKNSIPGDPIEFYKKHYASVKDRMYQFILRKYDPKLMKAIDGKIWRLQKDGVSISRNEVIPPLKAMRDQESRNLDYQKMSRMTSALYRRKAKYS